MGAQLSTVAPSVAASAVAINSYVAELGDVQYEKQLGNARFLSTIKGSLPGSIVIVKIFIKPITDIDLSGISAKLNGKLLGYYQSSWQLMYRSKEPIDEGGQCCTILQDRRN